MRILSRAVVAPLARLWVANSAESWRSLPRPHDAPFAYAAGPDPLRLLLIGSGMAVGYGVLSHDLGMPGYLARDLSALTGRGASVDVRASSDMTLPTATAQLATLDLTRFDAVIVTLGGLETLTLQPAASWRRNLDALLDSVEAVGESAPHVYVVDTGRMPSYLRMPQPLAKLAERHGLGISEESRAACAAHLRATWVAFRPRGGDAVRNANRQTYEEWAGLIAPEIARELTLPTRDSEVHADDAARVAAIDRLGLMTAPADDNLNRIVSTARRLLGVDGAAVTIVHRDHQRVWAGDGVPMADIRRDRTFCDRTIRRSGLTVVEDALATPGEWPEIPGAEGLRFYAGYPIEAPSGDRFGTLCVMDFTARQFSAEDATLLRDLALRVQGLVWERPGASVERGTKASDRASS